MKSLCAANSGAVLVSVACSVSLVLAPLTALKARLARSSSRPERSIATTVLSKVGAAGLLAIAVTSRFCCGHAGEQRGQIIAVLDLARNRASGTAACSACANGLDAGSVADAAAGLGRRGERAAERWWRPPARRTQARRLRIMSLPNISIDLALCNRARAYASLNVSRRTRPRRAWRPHSGRAWPAPTPLTCASSARFARPRRGDLAQRRIVEDDVGRNAGFGGERAPRFAQRLEQRIGGPVVALAAPALARRRDGDRAAAARP